MSNSVNYSCALIHTPSKAGKLNVDSNGYYECSLGAFNVYNSEGIYYPLLDSVKEMFAQGGALRRQLDRGLCRGEYGHPSPGQGQKMIDFIRRVLKIEPDRVSHHISNITLRETKDDKGRDIVMCLGRIKPSGPFGTVLNTSLENREENVAFSIRAICDQSTVHGRLEKHIRTIITWDYVNEPGISVANKYQTPTLEAIGNDIIFTKEDMIGGSLRSSGDLSLENDDAYTRVLTDLGWQKVQVINRRLDYLRW